VIPFSPLQTAETEEEKSNSVWVCLCVLTPMGFVVTTTQYVFILHSTSTTMFSFPGCLYQWMENFMGTRVKIDFFIFKPTCAHLGPGSIENTY
jgi:hypothetical protein